MNIQSILTLTILIGTLTQALAQPPTQPLTIRQADQIDLQSYTPPQIFEGQMVLRINTTTQQQLDEMLTLVESVWNESTGIGPLDIQIKRSNLPALTKLGIPHTTLIQDLQRYTNTNWTQMVQTQQQLGPFQRQGPAAHDNLWFANYKQLNEITQYIDTIAAVHPDLATTNIIGQSYEGRDMFSITISAPDSPENPRAGRPVVFLFSTVHAREWIAPMTTAYFASKLAEDYGSDPRIQAILNTTRVVIVPIGNPDGYLYSWTDYRYWRKNRRDNEGSSSFGVDINRNWGHEWGGPGSSGNPFSDTYRGTKPFSEPETTTLRNTGLSYGSKLIAHLEYHSYSQLIMYPWGYSFTQPPEPDLTYFELLTNELADEIYSVDSQLYDPIQASGLYRHAGNSPDWFYGELGIASLLIELRPQDPTFNPHPSNILPNAQENYQAAIRYFERAITPLSFWHKNSPTTPANTPFDLSIQIFDGQEEFVPSTLQLMTRTDKAGSYQPTAMTPTAIQNQFTTTIAPLPCGQTLEYYFQTTSLSGNTHTHPPATPLTTTPDQLVNTQIDTLETDTNWTVGHPSDTATAGIWTRMDPDQVLTDTQELSQPANNHTPDGTLCWITDGTAGANANDRDVDNGTTTLTSPIYDTTNIQDPYITFWYWLYRSDDRYPSLRVDLSSDAGTTWTTVDYLDGISQQWNLHQLNIINEVGPTNQIQIRFAAFDGGVDGTVEAAIDDISISFFGCPSTNPADLNNDGNLDFLDITLFLNAYAAQDPLADFNNDANYDFLDISAFLTAFTTTP